MSGDTAARPFKTRDNAGREQPSRRAASVTVRTRGLDALEADRLAGMGGMGHGAHFGLRQW